MLDHADLGAADPCTDPGGTDQGLCKPGMACHVSGLAAQALPQNSILLLAGPVIRSWAPIQEPVSHLPDRSLRPPIAL